MIARADAQIPFFLGLTALQTDKRGMRITSGLHFAVGLVSASILSMHAAPAASQDEETRRRRRDLELQLDELRTRREVENRRIEVLKAEAEERKRERIADQRLRGGSRFNLRYDGGVPRGITPREVMAALASYVNFPESTADDRRLDDRVPRKGMMRAEAEST